MFTLLRFFRPHRVTLLVIVLLTFLHTFGTLYIPTLTAEIVNKGIVAGSMSNIVWYGVWMLGVAVLAGAIAILGSWLSTRVVSQFSGSVREAVFGKAQSLPTSDFNRIGVASMITRATGDVSSIGQMSVMFLQMMLPAPLMVIAGLVLAFTKNQTLALMIVGTMLLFMLFTLFFGKKVIPLFRMVQVKMDRITRVLRENIIGVRVIRAFHREAYEKGRLDEAAADYAGNSIRINKLFAVFQPAVLLIVNACVIFIIWIGGKSAVQIGDMIAMVEYCFLILHALVMALLMLMYIPKAQASADRINEVLDMKPEKTEGADKRKTPLDAHVEFSHVTFRYPNAEEPVLDRISFEAKRGEVTAIIGGTGSGKSTIAQLLLRFFDIQAGSIRVGGADIREMPLKQLRDKIGYVPQKAFLFSGTIGENIRHGKADATDQELEHAAAVAQADGFIRQTPQGYRSYVAQGGSNFSGGQKQRLCIARALVRKPDIYVFDDSFSALDFKTDAVLRKALHGETRHATVIIVAQRISTILDADRIIVLDEGRIAGTGTHRELMKTCRVYRQIAHSQLSDEELAETEGGADE